MSTNWTQAEALELCEQIEAICPAFGCHVALTGGLLYKKGPRKDCDLVFYRIRQVTEIDLDGLWDALHAHLGMKTVEGWGWCYKSQYKGKRIDCFIPEEQGGEYIPDADPIVNRDHATTEFGVF